MLTNWMVIIIKWSKRDKGVNEVLFQSSYKICSLHSHNVIFISNRQRLDSKPPFLSQGIDPSSHVFHRIQMKYVNDDEDIRKYFAAFHLYDKLPAAVLIDDFGDFFDDKICQQRYSNPRGRDMAMVKTLALCHNAITFANQKGSCKVLLSDTHTHQRDSPRFHFIYKKWIQTTFTIQGDASGSFILKDKSHSPTDHNTAVIKAAKELYHRIIHGLTD
ncbi:uncharacterized protein HKW66_Vig0136140 [Vigna angularis]|uniref:Uncharacterized protein n=1 Tax=Phaseolus angularis TaxID=3914 RepID=A0A8T0KE52_PHAAN|nr:uncharacterized protein HKW66_Vig0136140 [Vigna angularis]